jgi:hypothetical protein
MKSHKIKGIARCQIRSHTFEIAATCQGGYHLSRKNTLMICIPHKYLQTLSIPILTAYRLCESSGVLGEGKKPEACVPPVRLADELDLPALHQSRQTFRYFFLSSLGSTRLSNTITRLDRQRSVAHELSASTRIYSRLTQLLQDTLHVRADTTSEAVNRISSDSTSLYANDKISRTDVTFSFTPSAMIAKS